MDLGLDVTQLRELVIRPALRFINRWNPAAENLVLGTGIHESRLQYIKQLGKGPALGLFQMEPATYHDIWRTHGSLPNLAERLRKLAGNRWETEKEPSAYPPPEEMIGNLFYAAAMSRVFYVRISEPLPAANDALRMARYWKKYYNTHLGKGTVEQALPAFELAVKG